MYHIKFLSIRRKSQAEIYSMFVSLITFFVEYTHLQDREPPIEPPKQVEDHEETKPDKWNDRETIVDLDAEKPDDW